MRRIIIIIAATALSSLSAFAQNTAKTLLNHEGSPIDIYQSVAPSGGGFRLVTTDKRHAIWTNGPLEVACSDLTAAALSSVGNAKIGCDIIGLALKSSIDGGAWAALGGGGSGDVTGPSSSVDNELTLFGSTSGKIIKSAGGTGIVFATSGVVSFLNSTGTGDVTRQNSPSIITPTIASFANATHDHSNAAGGGNIPEGSVMSLTGDLAAKAPLVSPSFTTPTLGVATTTSINKVSITAPAASATLTIANGATLTASATATVSGTNTGDQTSVSGNAGTATALQTARTINGVNFDGTANITVTAAGSTLSDTVTVAKGGTGQASLTAYAPLFGGTTTTGAVQSGTVGTSGQVLTSNGAGALPTFQAAAGGGANTALSNLASVAINTALLTGAGTTAAFTATAPAQTASSQAGTAATITASVAVAGSSNAGASAGGDVTVTSGSAARLTSGNANGGAINLTTGSGIGTGVVGNVVVTNGSISSPGSGGSTSQCFGLAACGSGTNNTGGGNTSSATTGSNNTWFGYASGVSSKSACSAFGYTAVCGADRGVVLGENATSGSSASDSIALGGHVIVSAAHTAIVGNGINGITDLYVGGQTEATASGVPASVTFHPTGASGTNVVGVSAYYAGAKSTGTAAGGNSIMQTAPSGASGSTLNTLLDRFTAVAQGKALTDNTATTVLTIPLPTLTMTGGQINWTIRCTDGTDVQSVSGVVVYSAVNKGGTYTTDIESPGFLAPDDTVTPKWAKALSGGTLTTVWTVTTGTNQVLIKVTADTSLTPSGTNGFVIYYTVTNNSEQSLTY